MVETIILVGVCVFFWFLFLDWGDTNIFLTKHTRDVHHYEF
ncbi:hypothetical protein [uncultured Gammaproteobacteria bacterium]|nr:hypothetical protein [uncultured Gammaproteobacteria bacterium]